MPDGLSLLPFGDHRVACPECSRKPSDKTLGVTVEPGHSVWNCFRCGLKGSSHSRDAQAVRYTRATPAPTPLEWSDLAEHIWRRTQGLRGTIGARYLEHRGCVLPPRGSHLRFLAADDKRPASLCAAITDAVTGDPISLHFTRLAADGAGKAGTDQDRLLLKGHRKRGGVIRLWPDAEVTTGLALAEGIETALAAAHAHVPIWSAIDAGNLSAFPVLDGIEALTVFADHDDAGRRAAEAVCQRWADGGREAFIVLPATPGADVADLVRA